MKNKMRNKENNGRALKWIYCRIRRYIPLTAAVSVISALSALSFVALALITKRVMDIATGDTTGSLLKSGILLFAVIAIQILLSAAQSILNAYSNGKQTIAFRNYLFGVLCRKKYADISAYHSGDILNRFTSDIDTVVTSSVNIIPNVVSIATKIVAGIGTMLFMNPYIAAAVLLCGVTFPAIGRAINKRYKYMHKVLICPNVCFFRFHTLAVWRYRIVIKTFISEAPFIKKLDSYMDDNFRLKIKRTSISVIANISLYALFTAGYYAVLLWGAGGLSGGTLTYGTLMAFLQLISQLRAPLQNVSGILPQYYSALASAERLMELEGAADEPFPAAAERLEKIKEDFRTLEIKNLFFGYAGESVLRDFSLCAKRGNITAITGESGSGKSTLFKLILGLYEPQSGSIAINGEIPLDASLRGLFAYVPQGNMVLSGTVRENITMNNRAVTDEQIERAARAAEIYDYITYLPDGFETHLAERGAGLSEGQIQRISIARALLTNAPILLLDEATSALDEETETRVLANIKSMTDKTVLFITHRNTSLKVCDRIVHVEGVH